MIRACERCGGLGLDPEQPGDCTGECQGDGFIDDDEPETGYAGGQWYSIHAACRKLDD